MKTNHHILILLFSIFCLNNTLSAEELILKMTSSDFSNWTYNRPNEYLSQSLIVSNNVLIYNDELGGNYTLSSNLVDLSKWKTIRIDFNWKANSYDQPEYNMVRNSPTISILSPEGAELEKSTYTISAAKPSTDISITFNLNSIAKGSFMFSAPLADKNSCGSINKIKIYGISTSTVDNIEENNNYLVSYTNGNLIIENATNQVIKIIDLVSGRIIWTGVIKDNRFSYGSLITGAYAVIINNKPFKIIVRN